MKKKILIITTGGTIAMKYNSPFGIVPDNEFIAQLEKLPQLEDLAKITFFEFANIPSPFITSSKILELAKYIDQKSDQYDGIVVTHGTDTLEETAFFLDLVIKTEKPVVFTAAMRSNLELGLDGPRNIIGAVRVAGDECSSNKGVLVVLNDEINAARDVVKSDSGKIDSFYTPNFGLLGIIDPDKVSYYRISVIREKIHTDKIETNIDLIKCVSSMDGRYIKASIENGAKAIVLEAFGRGNVPKFMVPEIKEAISKNIIVVVVSRTYTGRVLPEYGYEGGGASLKKIGVIFGEDLKGPKMRIKLMVLFGKYKAPELVRKYLLEN